mmetsp:Transcript_35253/g.75254  ORF Transcript_35253/g.75254 Transcript_35253/m.75254 type:complete len:151 (+) Transcript_35253:4267-4719(+)
MEQTINAGQPPYTFQCPICSRKFVFSSVNAGPGSFANHVKWCDPEKKRRKPYTKKELAYNTHLPNNETQVSEDEILSDASPIDPSEVSRGSRVIVIEAGERWMATIRKHHMKKNEPGYMIHYDGKKSNSEDWVPTGSVVSFIATEAEDDE